MKILLTLLALIIPSHASQLTLRTALQPLYVHGNDEGDVIKITEVPFVSSYADPEWRFTAISEPFVPGKDGSWKTPKDVNLVSLYGIKVLGTFAKDSQDMEVSIDSSGAKVPEGYPFTIEQVTDAAKTCVERMYPTNAESKGKLLITVIPPKD